MCFIFHFAKAYSNGILEMYKRLHSAHLWSVDDTNTSMPYNNKSGTRHDTMTKN